MNLISTLRQEGIKYQLKCYNSTCKIVVKVPKMMMKLLLYSAINFIGCIQEVGGGMSLSKTPWLRELTSTGPGLELNPGCCGRSQPSVSENTAQAYLM